MWSGLDWRARLPWAPSGTATYLLKENTTIKDMIEALHSPDALDGRATATALHRESSQASPAASVSAQGLPGEGCWGKPELEN